MSMLIPNHGLAAQQAQFSQFGSAVGAAVPYGHPPMVGGAQQACAANGCSSSHNNFSPYQGPGLGNTIKRWGYNAMQWVKQNPVATTGMALGLTGALGGCPYSATMGVGAAAMGYMNSRQQVPPVDHQAGIASLG